MLTDDEVSDLWLDKMIQPNEQVTIRKISNDGKYAIMEDRLFTYTDETQKLKNLRTGAIYEQTFNAGIKVATARIEKQLMQYLYNSR